MANEILSYDEMCKREGGGRLQRGMNYQISHNHSVILMSLRRNSPYSDRIEDNGETLIYEGHDISRRYHDMPKLVDRKRLANSTWQPG